MEGGGAGGQAEATGTDFGHHLARSDPFERADSPPSDGVRSKKSELAPRRASAAGLSVPFLDVAVRSLSSCLPGTLP